MRFRPEQHLRRQHEIRTVREQGRRLECRAFTLWWKRRDAAASEEAAPAPAGVRPSPVADVGAAPRVCVIASTAAVGNATRRNRAKRRLREVFREHQAAVPANCDLLLIARGQAVSWPMPDLARKFTEACRQIEASTGTS
jgi:ribonuclease P protein component